MLTKTYAFLSLSVEHACLQDLLASAQKSLQISSAARPHFDVVSLAAIADQLTRLDAFCRTRKLERCVIPAIRKATADADSLLDELAMLHATECQTFASVTELVQLAVAQKTIAAPELHAAIERYCHSLQERLKKEEKELLALAQRVISSEIWFAMGTAFLSMDAKGRQRAEHQWPERHDAGKSTYNIIQACC